ncbi:MAG: bifunctional pyr operon transcriptional regulator/uracil phosphoribosyltransferase PyrR [bacterium]
MPSRGREEGFFVANVMAKARETEIMDAAGLNRTLTRLAHEIVERNRGVDNVVLLGIRTRGLPLAERLNAKIRQIEGKELPLGTLDVTMYRDDVYKKIKQPVVQSTEIKFDIDGKAVIIVDDVLYTGRTVRAALDEIIDFGRPVAIQLAVLVDRGHRELPIRADYVGMTLQTASGEEVKVKVREIDNHDGVLLIESTREA